MKKRILAICAILIFCGLYSSAQIYVPLTPTIYGKHELRIKADSVQHVPEKDSLVSTVDTTAQIFYRNADSSFWGYSKARRFWKIGTGGSSSSGWGLTGNLGTNASSDYAGTGDAVDWVIRTNATERARFINSSGKFSTVNGALIQGLSIGLGGGNRSTNTAIGVSAMNATSSIIGLANTAIGYNSMSANTDGLGNTAIGYNSMSANTIGQDNTSIGQNSMTSGTQGLGNTAIGSSSLGQLTSGYRNIAIGTESGLHITNHGGRLLINSYSRGSLLNDTTMSIIYGAQDVSASVQRLYFNSRIFAKYIPSGAGDNFVKYNSSTGEFTYDASGGGSGISGLTTNELVYGNSATTIASLPVATYPSLPELSYIKGLRSSAQTQMDLLAPLSSPALTGNPTAPTQAFKDSSTKIATTAYADRAADSLSRKAIDDSAFEVTRPTVNGTVSIFEKISSTNLQLSDLKNSASVTWTKDADSNLVATATGGGTPGGSTTQMQYNNAGAFAGTSGATATSTKVTLVNPDINNTEGAYTSTATAAGTTTLTYSSNFLQRFTGTTTQTIVLPNATTLTVGHQFQIESSTTGRLTINVNGGTLLRILSAGKTAIVTCTDIGTSAGSWIVKTNEDVLYSTNTADFTGSNTTASQPIFQAANDRLNVEANTTYSFRLKMWVTNGTTTCTKALDFSGGTCTFNEIFYNALGQTVAVNTTGTAQSTAYVNQATSTVILATGTTGWFIEAQGTIKTNAAGTFLPRFKYSADPTGTVLIKKGSFIILKKLGTDTMSSIGDWN